MNRLHSKSIFTIGLIVTVLLAVGLILYIFVDLEESKYAMNDVNLTDEAVSKMTKEELWDIGVQHLNWPENDGDDLTKDEIHQKLLEGKYANFTDFLNKFERVKLIRPEEPSRTK